MSDPIKPSWQLCAMVLLWMLGCCGHNVFGQSAIPELTIEFDGGDASLVRILTGDGDCDNNKGTFGILNGAFVINDMEGATCCPVSPMQGMNDNRALVGPIIATNAYCDVTLTLDVEIIGGPFEPCLSGGGNPIGCTVFVPTFDPGGDGLLIESMLNGEPIMTSWYCGDQRGGAYTIDLGELMIGDVFTFLITGGTQDEDETYRLNKIEVRGRQRSLIAASISAVDSVLCEGLDPLILIEGSGGREYQWYKDGQPLPGATFSYNSGGVVMPSDEGIYSVIVTDAEGCITSDQIFIEVIPANEKQFTPTFEDVRLRYCIGDTVQLPLLSDEGISGAWSIPNGTIIGSIGDLRAITFVPSDLLYGSVTFDLSIDDLVRESHLDTICAGDQLFFKGIVFDRFNLDETIRVTSQGNTCDTLYDVHITIAPFDSIEISEAICADDTIPIGGELFHLGNLTGTITDEDSTGCITVYSVRLTKDTIQEFLNYDPCVDPSPIGDQSILSDTIFFVAGLDMACDTLYHITVSPSQLEDTLIYHQLCHSQIFEFNEQQYDRTRPTDTLMVNQGGCLRSVILDLDFTEMVEIPYPRDVICQGDTLDVFGELFYESRLEGRVVTADSNGCDTIWNVNISLLPTVSELVTIDPCEKVSDFRGIGIFGDTSITIAGEGAGCDSIFNIVLRPSNLPDSLIEIYICQGDTVVLNDIIFDDVRTEGSYEIVTDQGCRQKVNVQIYVKEKIVITYRDTLCSGADIMIDGKVFNSARLEDTLIYERSEHGFCDSIVYVRLVERISYKDTQRVSICEGDTVMIDDIAIFEGAEIADPILLGPHGCDTSRTIAATFLKDVRSSISRSVCHEEVVVVGEELFDKDRPMGSVTIPLSKGCDSIVDVRLFFPTRDTILYSKELCTGAEVTINGTQYSAMKPSGIERLRSSLGCDSIVKVDLSFSSTIVTELNRRICREERISIAGQMYDANNRNGVLRLTSTGGCDSIVNITISIDTVIVRILPIGSCDSDQSGSISVIVEEPKGMYNISLAGISFARPDTSVVFSDLPDGEYSVVVANERTCFFVYPVVVDARSSIQLSYSLEDEDPEFYQVRIMVSDAFQQIIWEPSEDLTCTECLDPMVRKGRGGTYRVTVQDNNGCFSSLNVTIPSANRSLFYLPNVISATSANSNGFFYLQATDDDRSTYDLTIFDRWGMPMFLKTDLMTNRIQDGWRGDRQGQAAASGVYIYKVVIRKEDGTQEIRAGEVLVIH